MLQIIPKARELSCDKGYDAIWFRAAIVDHRICPRISFKPNLKVRIPNNCNLTSTAINPEMFGAFKILLRVHTRFDLYRRLFGSTRMSQFPHPD